MPQKKVSKKSPISLNPVTHKQLRVECPFALRIGVKKPKRVPINMNWYRNAHHRESHQVKKMYLEHMRDQLSKVGLKTPVDVEVRVTKPSRRILDKHNVDSISKKFLYDAMTELGVWEDDNDEFVKNELTLPTIYEKGVEKVEFVFTSCKE